MKLIAKTMRLMATALLLTAVTVGQAKTYYLSTTGNDNNNGETEATAWATLQKAIEKAAAGDIVYIKGGTYTVTSDQIMVQEEGAWTVVYQFKKNGGQGMPISFVGVDGERPVFDFSSISAATQGKRLTGFGVTGSYYYFRNMELVGIQAMDAASNFQCENIRVYNNANHNTFENMAMHDGEGIGLYMTGHVKYNLVLNCDAYNNGSTYQNVKGNCDGFGCHPSGKDDVGNMFVGCRAWMNNDDGFDCISAYAPVKFINCWAWRNGNYWNSDDRKPNGDGNGIKAGGYGMGTTRDVSITEVPRHEVINCMASDNNSNGIYANHHLGGILVEGCTSYHNKYNYHMVNRRGPAIADAVDVEGYDHILRNNLSCRPNNSAMQHTIWFSLTDGSNTLENNTFQDTDPAHNLNDVTEHYAKRNNEDLASKRQANGELPVLDYLVLKANDYWADKGVGYTYEKHALYTATARMQAGIIKYPEELEDPYTVDETTTWDFSDLTEGTVYDYFYNYKRLVLRGTANNNHGITVGNGFVSFYGNGAAIETYLSKDRSSADDATNKNYDRSLAFNTALPGTCKVTFSAKEDNAERVFQIFFKAKGKTVEKVEAVVTKGQQTLELYADNAGTFFIAATIFCNVHEVKFEAGNSTGVETIHSSQFIVHNEAAPVFNLSGQRVGSDYRGIVIVNGRKVMRR